MPYPCITLPESQRGSRLRTFGRATGQGMDSLPRDCLFHLLSLVPILPAPGLGLVPRPLHGHLGGVFVLGWLTFSSRLCILWATHAPSSHTATTPSPAGTTQLRRVWLHPWSVGMDSQTVSMSQQRNRGFFLKLTNIPWSLDDVVSTPQNLISKIRHS